MTIPRTTEQIQSEINRIRANINQVRDGDLWKESEKEPLISIYEKYLGKLQRELAEKTAEAKQIEVKDSETLKP